MLRTQSLLYSCDFNRKEEERKVEASEVVGEIAVGSLAGRGLAQSVIDSLSEFGSGELFAGGFVKWRCWVGMLVVGDVFGMPDALKILEVLGLLDMCFSVMPSQTVRWVPCQSFFLSLE
jgi:hypothetical protein